MDDRRSVANERDALLFARKRSTGGYGGTSLIRNSPPLGPYSRTKSRALWWSKGGALFLMSEVPLPMQIPIHRFPTNTEQLKRF